MPWTSIRYNYQFSFLIQVSYDCSFLLPLHVPLVYGCKRYHCFLHEVCPNMAGKIHYYFHPMHSLTLRPIPWITLSHSKVENELYCVSRGYEIWPVNLYDLMICRLLILGLIFDTQSTYHTSYFYFLLTFPPLHLFADSPRNIMFAESDWKQSKRTEAHPKVVLTELA